MNEALYRNFELQQLLQMDRVPLRKRIGRTFSGRSSPGKRKRVL